MTGWVVAGSGGAGPWCLRQERGQEGSQGAPAGMRAGRVMLSHPGDSRDCFSHLSEIGNRVISKE